MGRKAGHLALGIGKAAGATLTLIPEEFARAARSGSRRIVDTLVGRDHQAPQRRPARRRRGHRRGRRARASSPRTSPSSRTSSATRTATCASPRSNIGEILKSAGAGAPASSSASRRRSWPRTSATSCAAPTRSPSTWSTRATSATARPSTCSTGGNAAMVSMQGGHFVPVPFARHARPGDRPRASAPGRHPLDALRDRAALHDPPAPRRLRGPARAREVRRDLRHCTLAGVPRRSSST